MTASRTIVLMAIGYRSAVWCGNRRIANGGAGAVPSATPRKKLRRRSAVSRGALNLRGPSQPQAQMICSTKGWTQKSRRAGKPQDNRMPNRRRPAIVPLVSRCEGCGPGGGDRAHFESDRSDHHSNCGTRYASSTNRGFSRSGEPGRCDFLVEVSDAFACADHIEHHARG